MIPSGLIIGILFSIALAVMGYLQLFKTDWFVRTRIQWAENFREPFKTIFFLDCRWPSVLRTETQIAGVSCLIGAALIIGILAYSWLFHGGMRISPNGTLEYQKVQIRPEHSEQQ